MRHFVAAILVLSLGCADPEPVETVSRAVMPPGTWACEAWNEPWTGYLLIIRQEAAYPSGTYDGPCLGLPPGVRFDQDDCPGGCRWPDGQLIQHHNVRFKARPGSFQGVFLGERCDGNQGVEATYYSPPQATWWVGPNSNLYHSPVTVNRVCNASNMAW